jgi:hypothetical protein
MLAARATGTKGVTAAVAQQLVVFECKQFVTIHE